MKTLTIVRHAKSSWKDRDLADFERPLNPRGKRDAQVMGLRLAGRGARPDVVISSPAARAYSTMKRISGEIGFPVERIIADSRVYEADAVALISIIREIDDIHDEVMLCGHNPGLTEFSNLISDGRIDGIPTCGVVSILFRLDSWKEIAPHSGALRYFDYPKNPAASEY